MISGWICKDGVETSALALLPAPINIGGTLQNPTVRPGGELALRSGAAVRLAHLGAPLPTIQFGTGEDHRCDQILARAKKQTDGQRLPRQGSLHKPRE